MNHWGVNFNEPETSNLEISADMENVTNLSEVISPQNTEIAGKSRGIRGIERLRFVRLETVSQMAK